MAKKKVSKKKAAKKAMADMPRSKRKMKARHKRMMK